MREMESLLPTLQPPPGGLARLRAHVDAQPSRGNWYHHLTWAAPLAACLVIAALWLPPWFAQRHRTATLVHALQQQAAERTAAHGIHVRHGAAIELPSEQANVRLYLVQSTGNSSNGSERSSAHEP